MLRQSGTGMSHEEPKRLGFARGRADALSAFLAAIGVILVVLALAIALYPGISAYWGAHRAQQQFTLARATASQYPADKADEIIAAAQEYNLQIAGAGDGEGVKPYESQLEYDATGILCWLEIPKLDIVLPVYRDDGTDEVPAEGAEHVRGTSLPVGGVPSNAVITAHSGSHRGTPMAFNKLEQLGYGDAVVLWTFGRPFAYEVTGSEVVEPDDIGNRMIATSDDELTLLTCRPIGTTAKRLFIHAARADYLADGDGIRIGALTTSEWFIVVVVIALVGAVLVALLLYIKWRRDRDRRKRGVNDAS